MIRETWYKGGNKAPVCLSLKGLCFGRANVAQHAFRAAHRARLVVIRHVGLALCDSHPSDHEG